MATIIVDQKISQVKVTFETVAAIDGYKGEEIQFKLPARHDLINATISWATGRLSIPASTSETAVIEWAIVLPLGSPEGGVFVSNGTSAALPPGNFGLLSIAGPAAAIFAGGIDVVVQVKISAPTGAIGRSA